MTDPLPRRVFIRRGRRALRRMTKRQRAIFWAMRFEDVRYRDLAPRFGIGADQVQAEFAQVLRIFLRTLREPEPWWQRLWPWW